MLQNFDINKIKNKDVILLVGKRLPYKEELIKNIIINTNIDSGYVCGYFYNEVIPSYFINCKQIDYQILNLENSDNFKKYKKYNNDKLKNMKFLNNIFKEKGITKMILDYKNLFEFERFYILDGIDNKGSLINIISNTKQYNSLSILTYQHPSFIDINISGKIDCYVIFKGYNLRNVNQFYNKLINPNFNLSELNVAYNSCNYDEYLIIYKNTLYKYK